MSRPSIRETTSRKSASCEGTQRGINHIGSKGDVRENMDIQAHVQTQALVLSVLDIGISAVAQHREQKRTEKQNTNS